MGWRKFKTYAKTQAGVDLTEAESKSVVKAYRSTFHEIPSFWQLCDDMLPYMARYPQFRKEFNGIVFMKETVLLPSGRFLRYDNLHKRDIVELDEDGNEVSRKAQWTYGDGVSRGIYGGLFVENCLAGDTEVLTDRGWKKLIDITADYKVYDGEQWCNHDGLLKRGVKTVIDFGGVRMTPDHKVLIEGEWNESGSTTASEATSSCERYFGDAIRAAASSTLLGERRIEVDLGDEVRVRYCMPERSYGVVERSDEQLWVSTEGTAGGSTSVETLRDKGVDPALSSSAGSADERTFYASVSDEPVYDLANCGVNHRFVVQTPGGEPFIVHNCVQATARDVIIDMALAVRERVLRKDLGEMIVNLVHDEIVCVVRLDRAEMVSEQIKTIMSTTPRYMGDMPLSCTVGVASNYAEAK
jgi:hypothetical protein